MPHYSCHKEVSALKIKKVEFRSYEDNWALHFVDESFAVKVIEREWLEKHMPVSGGYWVVYEDGYCSFSPGDVFEAGYDLIEEKTYEERP